MTRHLDKTLRIFSPAVTAVLVLTLASASWSAALKVRQIQAVETFCPSYWNVLAPEIHFLMLAGSLGIAAFTVLPHRCTSPLLALFCGFQFLHMSLMLLDTASFTIRRALIHPAELMAFFAAPGQIWSVVASALTGRHVTVGYLILATLGSACLAAWAWGVRAQQPDTYQGQLPVSRATIWILVAVSSWSGMTSAAQVRSYHRPVQVPLATRLATYLDTIAAEARASREPAPPLHIDRRTSRPPFNIILVVLESTNWFATSLAGGREDSRQPPTTPMLLELAQGGLEAERTYASAMHTSKSLISLLCGHHPYPFVRSQIETRFILNPCLPTVLQQGGYETAFIQAPTLTFEGREGLARTMGFAHVSGGDQLDSEGFEWVNYHGREDRIVLKPALSWVKNATGPYMLTIMTGTSHHPYGSPLNPAPGGAFDLTPGGLDRFHDAVRYVDQFLRELLDGIRSTRGLENTLVIAVGDHGEGFGEHGLYGHDWIPYEEGTRIPLVLWGPDVLGQDYSVSHPPGTRLDGLFSQVDLYPTVLDLLGWRWDPAAIPGNSLFSPEGHSRVWTACMSADRCSVLWDEQYKYVRFDYNDSLMVFDLKQDPGERTDRARRLDPSRLVEVESILKHNITRVSARYHEVARAAEDLPAPSLHLEVPMRVQVEYGVPPAGQKAAVR